MAGAFDAIEELGHIVEGDSGLDVPEIAGLYLEGLRRRGDAPGREAPTQDVVDHLLERSTVTSRFRLELGRDVVIKGQRGSHIMMLMD